MAYKFNVFTGQFDLVNASSSGGGGDVNGPGSSTDNAVVRFDGTTGKTIQNSNVTIDDSGNIVTPGEITADGTPIVATLDDHESRITAVEDDVDDLIALSGVAANSTNLGTFTGTTIPDNSTNKQAFQALETALEDIPSPFFYAGTYNATTNTPNLDLAGARENGAVYYVTVAGTHNFGSFGGSITLAVGDKIVYNGVTSVWDKWDNTDDVNSVFGRIGAVVAQSGDYTASQVTNAPAGSITATNVQDALNQLDNKNIAKSNIIYVDKLGNDTTGNGSFTNPYLTVAKAISMVTSPSSANRWQINVGIGTFTEATLTLTPWTWIAGADGVLMGGGSRINVSSNSITLAPAWATGSQRGGLTNLYLTGSTGINFDRQAISGLSSVVYEIFNVGMNGNLTIKAAQSTLDFLDIRATRIFGSLTCSGGSIQAFESEILSNIDFNTSGTQNLTADIINSVVAGNISATSTGANTTVVRYLNTNVAGTKTATGSGTTVTTNLSYYKPTDPTDWTVVPDRVDSALDELADSLTGHINDTSGAHAASAISNTPAGTISSTNVQSAINELDGDVQAATTSINNHISNPTGAHAGTAISNTPAGSISSTTVQAAINELDGDITTVATNLSNHISDTTDAHDASAISYDNTSSGLMATNVQDAIDELSESMGGFVTVALSNNQSSPTNVTGFVFDSSTTGFNVIAAVAIDATVDLYEVFILTGINKNTTWEMSVDSTGDTSGIIFSITSAGQIQYTSLSYSGFVSATLSHQDVGGSITFPNITGLITAGTNITITGSGTIGSPYQISSTGGGGASPLTTKGDLYTYSTVDARLGVGSNNQVLIADSAQTTGLKYALIADANIAVAAAMDASKIANGSVSNTEFQYLDGVTSAIQTQFSGKQSAVLTSAHILVGNGSNLATDVAVSGDLTLTNTGDFQIASGAILNADVNASAAIARTKLASGTNYRILANNSSGVMSENAAITASRAVASDTNGQLVASATTATELGYVNGVTSAIQTQLDLKASITYVDARINYVNLDGGSPGDTYGQPILVDGGVP